MCSNLSTLQYEKLESSGESGLEGDAKEQQEEFDIINQQREQD
jgi:hypothetical protein